MTAGRTDTAAGSSATASPRPPVLTEPDLGRLRDGEADELAAGEMVEDLELVEADLSGGDLSAINGTLRPGIVHRLDKDTSGVMIAAKNDAAHRDLAEQIQTKTAQRIYLTLVDGNIEEAEGVIHGAIGRSPKDRQKMAVVSQNGKAATTTFRVLERFGDYTLLSCQLLTGRTHQIRVHMAYIGHPVTGDPKYGRGKCRFSIQGQALHSRSLTFCHPTTRETMTFTAPLPSDMEEILQSLRCGEGGNRP